MKRINESEMVFGDYEEDVLFQIENSQLHKSFGEGIKTVEFILADKGEKLLFVEAKKSCPNAANRNETEEKKIKYEEYYSDITDKFNDSFQMFLTTVLKRNMNLEGIGKKIKGKQDFTKTVFKFVLVIKNAEDIEWLAGPKAELEERLMRMRKIWKTEVVVLNETLAKEYGIVQ